MKLIRCHIENFGVLSDFDFTFDEGLTTICQSNGFGKSTFVAFIKSMFYGFPRTGARNIVENERDMIHGRVESTEVTWSLKRMIPVTALHVTLGKQLQRIRFPCWI